MEEEFLSIQNQKKKVDQILEDKSFGQIGKIFKLHEHKVFNKKIVQEHLFTNNLTILEELFCNPAKVKKMRPQAKSADKWDQTFLDYYQISFQFQSEEEMFGDTYKEDLKILPKQVKEFLDQHPLGSIKKYEKTLWEDPKANDDDIDEYSKLICDSRRSANSNDVIRHLLNKYFKSFVVRSELILNLWVCNKIRVARPDFTLMETGYQSILKGLVVFEDKIENNNGIPQLIAEGIAVVQQPNWNLNWPVYMIYCKGFYLQVYKAFFSKNLIDNIKNGYDCFYKTIVFCLKGKIRLDDEEDLIHLSFVFNAIKSEIKSR